jgi:hypothetical protein
MQQSHGLIESGSLNIIHFLRLLLSIAKVKKGWFTVDVGRVVEIVRQHGKLKLLDDYDLVVETDGELEMTSLAEKLPEAFGEEMGLEPYIKKKLD